MPPTRLNRTAAYRGLSLTSAVRAGRAAGSATAGDRPFIDGSTTKGDDMYCELPTAEATTPTRKHIRELAERTSNGTLMRLLWLEGTRELWVEIREPELDVTVVIPAEPERALEAFYHPYAYVADSAFPQSAEPLRRS
jgi:hypothetical protein